MEQIPSPEGPDDEPAHEAGGERREQDGGDDAEVEGPRIDRAVQTPGETHHAAPDRRRQTIPPIRRAKAAIGSITNAAVNNVTLSRMCSGLPPLHFARRVPEPFRFEFNVLRLNFGAGHLPLVKS